MLELENRRKAERESFSQEQLLIGKELDELKKLNLQKKVFMM